MYAAMSGRAAASPESTATAIAPAAARVRETLSARSPTTTARASPLTIVPALPYYTS